MVLIYSSRSSNHRIESTVVSVEHQIEGQSTALSISQRLDGVRNTLNTPDSNTQLPFGISPEAASSSWNYSQWSERSRYMCVDEVVRDVKASGRRICRQCGPDPKLQCFGLPPGFQSSPSSPFESLKIFRPGSYTVDFGFATLYGYDLRGLEDSRYLRAIHCSLFYFRDHREWVRLTVSVTISIESSFWNAGRARSGQPNMKGNTQLDRAQATVLEAFLKSQTQIAQDSHLNMFLGKDSGNANGHELLSRPAIHLARPHFQVRAHLVDVTRRIRHWNWEGYRWFRQSGIVDYSYVRNQKNFFSARLQLEWVFECRFGSNQLRIETNLYHLQVLHTLQGIPGISRLHGLVFDDDCSKGVVTGFLCQLLAKGRLCLLMAPIDCFGEEVMWHDAQSDVDSLSTL